MVKIATRCRSPGLSVGRSRYFARDMSRRLRGALSIVAVALAAWAQAQDAVFSQFYAAPLLLNPAFAGMTRAPSIHVNHRSQYVGFNGGIPYQTYALSYGQFAAPLNSGFGVSLFADQAGQGILATYAATAYYAYQVAIDDDNVLRLGLSAGVQQRRLDWDRLTFFDQLDPETGPTGPGGSPNPTNEARPTDPNVLFPDFGAGVLYAGRVAYAGLTVDHLTTPDDRIANRGPGGFYRGYPMRVSLHAGAQINLRDGSRDEAFVTPNVLYTRQGAFEQVNVGAYASMGVLFGGAWFRHTIGNADAVIGVVGVHVGPYKLGYSYDATVSDLSAVSAGTHELSLQINFEDAAWIKRRRAAMRYNDCLQLFR